MLKISPLLIRNHFIQFILTIIVIAAPSAAFAKSILFIGNSFTYGETASAQYLHPEIVTDLNRTKIGGVPAIYKMLSKEAGNKYNYDVYLETVGGSGLNLHYTQKRALLNRKWDVVVMQTYSTLDARAPGNPATLVEYSKKLADMFRAKNPNVKIYLTATWSRADQVYRQNGHWFGKSTQAMANDILNGYQAALKANNGEIQKVIPLGTAWENSIRTGIADGNPYDGIEYNKMNLWGWDNYHASNYGYYLHALMVFGAVNDYNVSSFGKSEVAARKLGISPTQAEQLQRITEKTLLEQ